MTRTVRKSRQLPLALDGSLRHERRGLATPDTARIGPCTLRFPAGVTGHCTAGDSTCSGDSIAFGQTINAKQHHSCTARG